MDFILFIDTPSKPDISSSIALKYKVSNNLIDANIVISENEIKLPADILYINISNKRQADNIPFIDMSLPIETIMLLIEGMSITYMNTMKICRIVANPQLKNSDALLLADKLNRYENIINNIGFSVLYISKTGDILYSNKHFNDLRRDGEEGLIKNFFDMLDQKLITTLRSFIENSADMKLRDFVGSILLDNDVTLMIEGKIVSFKEDKGHYEIVFDSMIDRVKSSENIRKLEEQNLVSGFSRHISHNIMNALTAAGGFIRQVKSRTDSDPYMSNMWKIIESKLQLIEEVVLSYSDYTHSLSFKLNNEVNLSTFYKELVTMIAEKHIDQDFSAQLYRFTDMYDMAYDFTASDNYMILGNVQFLKLSLCYIIKDNIRFFLDDIPLSFHVKSSVINNRFSLTILVEGVEIADQVLSTILEPWDHSIHMQSFDYWGIVIAKQVIERHMGQLEICKTDKGIEILLLF